MAYTAELLGAVKSDTEWKIRVKFVDGAYESIRVFRFTGTTTKQLVDFVRGQGNLSDKVKTSTDFTQFIGKVLDLTPATPTPPPTPTAAEIAKTAWFVDYTQLNRVLAVTTAVPSLRTAQVDTLIANLRTSLTAGWLNSYLGDIE